MIGYLLAVVVVTEASSDPTANLLQYGALGVLALMCLIAVRVLFAQVAKDKERETARADRNEEALKDLNAIVQNKVIPAAAELVTTSQRLIELIARLEARLGRDK